MREMKHIHTMQFLRECTAQFLIYAAVSLISVVFIWILADLARGGIAHLSWEFLMEPHAMPDAQAASHPYWFPRC